MPTFNFNSPGPAIIGNSYFAFLGLTGGNGQFTISVTSGSLPPGLAVSGSFVNGFPTQLGIFTANLQAVDTSSPPYTATTTITITVVAAIDANETTHDLGGNLGTKAAGEAIVVVRAGRPVQKG